MQAALDEGADHIDVYINSLGGDVYEALKIRQLFLDCEVPVRAHIFGLTASAATLVATGCDEVLLSRFALLLFHRSDIERFDAGRFNSRDLDSLIASLQADAKMLTRVDDLLAQCYAAHAATTDAAQWLDVMDREEWLTPEEVIALGFASGLLPEERDYKEANPADCSPRKISAVAAMGYPAPYATEAKPAGETPALPGEQALREEIDALRTGLNTLRADFDTLRAEVKAAQAAADRLTALYDQPAIDTPAGLPQAAASEKPEVPSASAMYEMFRGLI